MAHFARINDHNSVVHVHVVDNQNLLDENGVEQESLGIQFLQNLYGDRFGSDRWVQCSYNNNFRKKYPGLGFIYREDLDAFILPQPYPSWNLDLNFDWQPPVPIPDFNYEIETVTWNEETKQWDINQL